MTHPNYFSFFFLVVGLFTSSLLLAEETEEIISVGSYLESNESNAAQ
jgi:hypothetical protein